MNNLIHKAIMIAGNQEKLAAAVGVSQTAVHKWLKGGKISAENAFAIHTVTNGAVDKCELRPDIFNE